MEAARLLELVRPLVLVIDGWGQILAVHGGCGGFLGHDVQSMKGMNALAYVAPADHEEIASYFVTEAADEIRTTLLPLPFRVRMVAPNGLEHPVDVIPTGRPHDPEVNGWIVVLVPLSMQAGPSRSLDAELAGASRHEVKQLLAEELAIDNPHWTTRLFLVDLPGGQVIGGRIDDFGMADVIHGAIADGWQPWTELGADGSAFEVAIDGMPAGVHEFVTTGGWNVVEAAPVLLDGQLVAAFVRFSRAHDLSSIGSVRTNVESRIRGLVEVTRLLFGRWRVQDALMTAATTDALTGLANRETFTRAMRSPGEGVAVVYIDIDDFKRVNDRWGHAAGDRVLVEVASRISAACRPGDVVARFGGDEFVVLLRDVDATAAERIGRRILEEVAAPLGLDDGPARVSVSIGLASRRDGIDPVELADRAMLSAKRQGRARLVAV